MSALEIADIIGIISFALSGFLIAVHCKLDILGVFISAFLLLSAMLKIWSKSFWETGPSLRKNKPGIPVSG